MTKKFDFSRQNDVFLRFGGSAELTEGSAEPFGFGRTLFTTEKKFKTDDQFRTESVKDQKSNWKEFGK